MNGGILDLWKVYRRLSDAIKDRNVPALLQAIDEALRIFDLGHVADQIKVNIAAVQTGDWRAIMDAVADTLHMIAHLGDATLPPLMRGEMVESVDFAERFSVMSLRMEADNVIPATMNSTGKLNRVYCARIRIETAMRVAVENPGKLYFFSTLKKLNDIDDARISAEADKVGIPVGQLGDGTIWATIVAFFQTPQGIALKDALIKALMVILGLIIV